MNSILGLVHLVLAIIAIISIVKSSDSGGKKVLWILVSLIFFIIGPVLYLVLGRKK